MNNFEESGCYLLESEGYWVTTGYKVNISAESKKRLGKVCYFKGLVTRTPVGPNTFS